MKVSHIARILASSLVLAACSCSETITATLTIDPNGGRLVYYPSGSTEPVEVASDDPVFDLAGSYSYTAAANSELPEVISTLQSVRDGYHFLGWGNLVNGEVQAPYLQDFSSARMPYSDVTYQAVFTPLSTLTFVPVDEDFQPLEIAGETVDSYVLSGDDIYVGAILDNTTLSSILAEMTGLLPEEEYPSGQYSGIYASADSSDALGSITIEGESETYYVVFTDYPLFTIDWGLAGLPDTVYPVAPGSSLAPYLPTDVPEVEGAIFDGWYTDEDFTSPFYIGDEFHIMSSSSLTIYARYLREVQIDYALPDGWKLGDDSPTTLYEDTIPELVDPVAPAGFTFTYWYIDLDGDGEYTADTDILLNGYNRIPVGYESLTLRPLYDEWDRVYIDLRGVSYSSVPSALTEASEDIYYLSALPGHSIDEVLDAEEYGFDSSLRFDGFVFYYLDGGEYSTLEEQLDASEESTPATGFTTMPDASVVAVPTFTGIHDVTLHLPGGDRVVTVEDDGILDGYDDEVLGDVDVTVEGDETTYIEEVLTGWSLEEGDEAIEYPIALSDITELYPVYTRRTSLTFQMPGETETLVLMGLEGDSLTVAEKNQVTTFYEQYLEENQKIAYYTVTDSDVTDSDGKPGIVSAAGDFKFLSTNAVVEPYIV